MFIILIGLSEVFRKGRNRYFYLKPFRYPSISRGDGAQSCPALLPLTPASDGLTGGVGVVRLVPQDDIQFILIAQERRKGLAFFRAGPESAVHIFR